MSRRSHELVGELTAVTSFNEIAMLRPLFGIKSIYSTTIVAKTDCDLYCLSNTDMLTALSHAPRVIQNIMEGAVDKYMHILHKGNHSNPGARFVVVVVVLSVAAHDLLTLHWLADRPTDRRRSLSLWDSHAMELMLRLRMGQR